MAAAHRGRARRRTHLPRRRKGTTGRKCLRRKLLPKRRKQCLKQGRQGRKMVSKGAKPPRPSLKNSCDELVIKVLRKLHRDRVSISTKAKGRMISFIRRFYNNVSKQAKCSKRAKKSCTIGSKELQNALKRVMRKKQAMELVKTVSKVSRRR